MTSASKLSERPGVQPVIKRMALAIYRKAEELGVSVDTAEGGGDLTGATLIAMAAFDAMFACLEEEQSA